MTHHINKIIGTLLFCLVMVTGLEAAKKMVAPESTDAALVAVEHYNNTQGGYGIPEFEIIGKAYPKYHGHVVVLKRVDKSTAQFLDESVAIYHVANDNIEILDFVNTYVQEGSDNPMGGLYLDLQYGFKTQIIRELKNGNTQYLGEFLSIVEGLDDWSLVHFNEILNEVEQFLRFETAHQSSLNDSEELLKRVSFLRNKKGEITLLNQQGELNREQIRQFAINWFLMEIKDGPDMDEGIADGVTAQVKEEKLLDNGRLAITVELFGGIAGTSLGHEKTYVFDTDGQLMRS